MNEPLVSFVVPTIDRPEELARFLDSVDAQHRTDCEVIVVDQGAASVESLVSRCRSARYVQNTERGLSRNRNVGLRIATGRVLVFADDDCVLDDGYVEALARALPALESSSAFGYGETLTLEDGRPFVPTFRVRRRPIGSWHVDTLCSVGLVFPRMMVDRAGGFDERFGIGAQFPAGEETDLLLRLAATGVKGVWVAGLRLRHPRRARSAELVQRYRSFGYGHGALARKHAANTVYLARFCYGLARTFAGVVVTALVRPDLAPLYRASLDGKVHGFRDYQPVTRPVDMTC